MSLATLRKAAKKPSSLIRLALADLVACEKDPKYKIDMQTWHEPFENMTRTKRVCHVCFAGAVLAKTLNAPVDKDTSPTLLINMDFAEGYRSPLGQRVCALNSLRAGDLVSAIYYGWYSGASAKVQENVLGKLRKAFPSITFSGKGLGDSLHHKSPVTGSSYRTKEQRAKFRRSMADVARRLEKVGL